VQRDRIDGLESTNAALRDRLAVVEGQRAALAERLLAGQTWQRGRLVSEDLVPQPELREIFGIPLAAPLDGIARLTVPLLALREDTVQGEHYPVVHHDHLIPHDLELPVVGAGERGTATPFGCRWCGTQRSDHGRRYLSGRGMHGWEQPTQAQIKARMLARRAARTGGAR
jgi:hypothetical protein